MKIEIIELTEVNLMSVITDKDVFIIKSSMWYEERIEMIPIGKCDISDLLSGNSAVIRVIKEES